jgi:hypothetical protein
MGHCPGTAVTIRDSVPFKQALLDPGAIRHGVDPLDLLGAVGKLCIPPGGTDDNWRADRMIALLIDGLRYGAAVIVPVYHAGQPGAADSDR